MDIYRLEEKTLQYAEYLEIIARRIYSLEDRIKQNANILLELSKRVKETESLQDQLQQQLKTAQNKSQDFEEISTGIKEVIRARREELEKNRQINGDKDEDKKNETE